MICRVNSKIRNILWVESVQLMTAYKEPSFDGHQAMPAIIAQDDVIYDSDDTQSTPLTQRGGGKKISAFTQTEQIKMVDMSTQTMVEMSTQTEEEEISAVLSNCLPTQVEDRQEIMVAQSGEMIDPKFQIKVNNKHSDYTNFQ